MKLTEWVAAGAPGGGPEPTVRRRAARALSEVGISEATIYPVLAWDTSKLDLTLYAAASIGFVVLMVNASLGHGGQIVQEASTRVEVTPWAAVEGLWHLTDSESGREERSTTMTLPAGVSLTADRHERADLIDLFRACLEAG